MTDRYIYNVLYSNEDAVNIALDYFSLEEIIDMVKHGVLDLAVEALMTYEDFMLRP